MSPKNIRDSYGGDFFDRINRLSDNVHPAIIALGLIFLIIMIGLALFGKKKALIWVLIVSLVFSGSEFVAMDSASTICRWTTILLLALTWFRNCSIPGVAWLCYAVYLAISCVFIGRSENPSFSIQSAGLSMAVALAAASCVQLFHDRRDARGLCIAFVVAGSIWAGVMLLSIPRLFGGGLYASRFSGGTVSAPLFTITGGMLLLFVIWLAINAYQRWLRIYCIGLAIVIFLGLLISGQRAGTFGAIIGCGVLLLRGGIKQKLAIAAVLAMGIITGSIILQNNPRHLDFITQRYTSMDSTGRTKVWTAGLEECMQSPILGRGSGSATIQFIPLGPDIEIVGYHNAFISAWYDSGFFGLVFFVASIGFAIFRLFRLQRMRSDPEIRQMSRLFLAILISLSTIGMVENSFYSASTIATIVFVISLVSPSGLERLAGLVRNSRRRNFQYARSSAWIGVKP